MTFVNRNSLITVSQQEKFTLSKYFKPWTIASYLIVAVTGAVNAAPVISQVQVSGRLTHKATVTIIGSGFGTKSTAAPVVWDDASGANIRNLWDGAWPDGSGPTGATYQTLYRLPQRGISLPHSNITRYIAGGHGDSAGANAGYDVMFWKSRTISLPAFTYASWYQRADDNWVFGLGSPADNNFKFWDYSIGSEPFNNSNWYINYGSHTSKTVMPQWVLNDDGNSLSQPDVNGHGYFWNVGVNPMGGQWAKLEVQIKYTNLNDGFIKAWENGALRVNYLGPTDKYASTARVEAIGGYTRGYGNPNQWRYFADVYLDYTFARVVLANSATLSAATIIENQIPTTWSDTAISVSVNLGQFTVGQAAYLFVVDPSGVPCAAGTRVTIGATSAPANLKVQ